MRWENTLLLKVSPSVWCPAFEALFSWMSRGSSLTPRSQFLFWCSSLYPHLGLFLTLIDLLLTVYKMERSNDDLSDLPSLRFVVPRNTKYPVTQTQWIFPAVDFGTSFWENRCVWSLIWVFAMRVRNCCGQLYLPYTLAMALGGTWVCSAYGFL